MRLHPASLCPWARGLRRGEGQVDDLADLAAGGVGAPAERAVAVAADRAVIVGRFDGGVERVYKQINSHWEETARDALLISLSGGILDNQLASEPSSLTLARIWYENAMDARGTPSKTIPRHPV